MSSVKPLSFSVPSSFTVIYSLFLIIFTGSLQITCATTTPVNTNQSQIFNVSNIQIRSPPPAKSLFNSQFFNSDNILGGVMKTFVNSLPLRESYIAFEQAHPGDPSTSSQEFDQYFKPSKYPGLGYDVPPTQSYYNKLQNPFSYPPQSPPPYYPPQQSQYYLPFSPPPPQRPPPAQPFLRLVKIPGDLKITVSGGGRNDLEVVCEFPPYVLIVQQIYWHVIPPPSSLLLPYGTFYDSLNGFAPRVTVTNVSKWKSVLTVRDYSPDDYGTYRCVTTAILPEEPEPSYSVQLAPQLPPPQPTSYYYPPPPHSHHHHHPHSPYDSLELRSSGSSLSSSQADPELNLTEDLAASSSKKRERRIKFVRRKREIGAFGVHAPFFKPYYGIFRVFKEIKFFGDPYGVGSELMENTISSSETTNKGTITTSNMSNGSKNGNSKREGREDSSHRRKNSGRKFDHFSRRSKVLF